MEMLLAFVSHYQGQIWSVIIVIIGTLVAQALRLRPHLHYSIQHASNILVDQPLFDKDGNQILSRQIIRTASIVVGNSGRHPANNVEVSFNWRPAILNVIPARSYSDVSSPFDRYSLKFDSFAPNEQITIDIIGINVELPSLTAVRCDECQGKEIPMLPQRVWPSPLLAFVAIIMLIGGATSIYFIMLILEKVLGLFK